MTNSVVIVFDGGGSAGFSVRAVAIIISAYVVFLGLLAVVLRAVAGKAGVEEEVVVVVVVVV